MRAVLGAVLGCAGWAAASRYAFAGTPAGEIESCLPRMLALSRQPPGIDSINAVRSVCEQLQLANARIRTEDATARIYEAQLMQNTVMLWLVVSLTFAGVVLAAIQLWATYKLTRAGQGVLASGGEAVIEQGKLVVRSSVVGIIILAMSFAFFSVYVMYVYRISEIGSGVAIRAPPPGAEEISR